MAVLISDGDVASLVNGGVGGVVPWLAANTLVGTACREGGVVSAQFSVGAIELDCGIINVFVFTAIETAVGIDADDKDASVGEVAWCELWCVAGLWVSGREVGVVFVTGESSRFVDVVVGVLIAIALDDFNGLLELETTVAASSINGKVFCCTVLTVVHQNEIRGKFTSIDERVACRRVDATTGIAADGIVGVRRECDIFQCP